MENRYERRNLSDSSSVPPRARNASSRRIQGLGGRSDGARRGVLRDFQIRSAQERPDSRTAAAGRWASWPGTGAPDPTVGALGPVTRSVRVAGGPPVASVVPVWCGRSLGRCRRPQRGGQHPPGAPAGRRRRASGFLSATGGCMLNRRLLSFRRFSDSGASWKTVRRQASSKNWRASFRDPVSRPHWVRSRSFVAPDHPPPAPRASCARLPLSATAPFLPSDSPARRRPWTSRL